MEQVKPIDLTGSQVAVFDALGHIVLIGRLTEPAIVVGDELRILLFR